MNKKLLITIGIILGLVIVAGGFWYFFKLQKTNMDLTQNNAEKITNNQKQEKSQKQNNRESQANKQENEKEIKQIEIIYDFNINLSEEDIEKLKKEKDLVWYEIPELGIKFLVTEDTKNDLRYIAETKRSKEIEENKITVFFYYQSAVNFLGSSCLLNNQIKKTCTEGALSRYSVKLNESYKERNDMESMLRACQNSNIITNIDDDIVCFTGSQALSFGTLKRYKKYLNTIKGKNFGIYLGTAESIQSK